jgi:hypothetical protein
MRLKPSPIAMDAINAIIVRRQSAHERSPSDTKRKANAISLKAIKRPCRQTQQELCEGVESIMLILIPQWQLLPQGLQLPQRVHDGRKLQCFADQCRSHGSYIRRDDGNNCHRQHGQCKQQQQAQTKTKKHSCNDTCTIRHARGDRWTSSEASCLAEPVTSSLSSDERTNASEDNNKYHFVSTPKN